MRRKLSNGAYRPRCFRHTIPNSILTKCSLFPALYFPDAALSSSPHEHEHETTPDYHICKNDKQVAPLTFFCGSVYSGFFFNIFVKTQYAENSQNFKTQPKFLPKLAHFCSKLSFPAKISNFYYIRVLEKLTDLVKTLPNFKTQPKISPKLRQLQLLSMPHNR